MAQLNLEGAEFVPQLFEEEEERTPLETPAPETPAPVTNEGLNLEGAEPAAAPSVEEAPALNLEGAQLAPTSILENAQKFDAELVGKARKLGISARDAMANPELVTTAEKRRKEAWDTLREQFPDTAKFLDNPENAALSHDDISALTKIEGQLRDWWSKTDQDTHITSSFFGGMVSGLGDAASGLGEVLYALEQQLMSNLRNSFGAERVDTARAYTDAIAAPFQRLLTNVFSGEQPVFSEDPNAFIAPNIEEVLGSIGGGISDWSSDTFGTPDKNSHPLDRLASGLGGLANQAILSSNPIALATYLSALGAHEQAQQIDFSETPVYYRDRATAILAATPVTAITEWSALERILAPAKAPGFKGAVRSMAGAGVYEAGQEQAEKALQGLITGAATGDEQDLLMGADELLDVFLVGSVAHGTSLAIRNRTKKWLEHNLADTAIESGQNENRQANQMLDAVQESLTAERSPEAFREYLNQIEHEGTSLYVSLDAVQEALATEVADDEHNNAAMELLSSRIDEDPDADTIMLTGEEAASILFTSDYADALREHYTLNADSVAPAKAEEVRANTSAFVDKMVDRALEMAQSEAEARQVYEQVLGDLKEVGHLSAADRRIMARIVPAWAAAKARREGKTALQVMEEANLVVRKADLQITRIEGLNQTERQEDGSLQGLPRIRDAAAFEPARQAAEAYMASAGMEYRPPSTYALVDEDRARRIAEEYEKAEHRPNDPEVQAAYRQMVKETLEQYKAILATGIKIEMIPAGAKDPYAETPRMATEDARNNNHLWVYSTREGFGTGEEFSPDGNPLLEDSGFTDANGVPMLANDVFRAVHDYFGHVKEGVGFRADGEENAWRAHAAMYSPLARRAMTTETRGQNSWLNYGPYGEKNRTAKPEDTVFADQKTTLLPEWVSEEAMGDPAPERMNQVLSIARGWYQMGTGTIGLTQVESRMTFLHEMAHFMLDMEDANGAVWQGTRDWLSRNGLVDFAQEAQSYLHMMSNAANTAEQRERGFTEATRALAEDDDHYWGFSYTDVAEWRAKYGDNPDKFMPEDGQLVTAHTRIKAKQRDAILQKLQGEADDSMDFGNLRTWAQVYAYASSADGPQRAGELLAEQGVMGINREVGGKKVTTLWGPDFMDAADANTQWASTRDLVNFNAARRSGKIPDVLSEETILSFTTTGTTGDAALDSIFTRALHEKFARGFEKYLMEGNAPTAEMARTFRDISRWGGDLYAREGGTDSLNVELDDTMRRLFDSLITTPEQIEREAARSSVEDLFTSAAEAGMTQEEYDKYLEEQESRKEKAEKTVREKIVGLIKARMTREYKKRVAEAKEALREEVENERLHRAREALKGDLRLDYNAAADIIGKDGVNKDGEPIKIMPNRLRGMWKKGGEGTDPQVAAELLGYSTAEEMLRDIVEGPTFNQDLEARAQARAEEQMGGTATQEQIAEMVEQAVRNEVTEAEILAQLRVLTRTPEQDEQMRIRQKAEEMIGGMPLSRIRPATYRAAYTKAAKAAAKALREGNREEAAKHKRRQYMYLHAEIQARKALSDAKAHRAWAKQHSSPKNIVALARRGGGFAEQFQKVLQQFKLTNNESLPFRDDTGLSVGSFAKRMLFSAGQHINVSQAVRLGERFESANDMTPDQLKGAIETLKSLERNSKNYIIVVKAKEQAELNDLVNALGQSLEGRDPRHPIKSEDNDLTEAGYWSKFKKHMADWIAYNTKVPWMMRWMDGGKAVGIWHQTFTQPLTDAFHEEQKIIRAVFQPIATAIRERSEADIQRHRRKHSVTLPDGTTLTLSGHQILHLASHLGNAEGRRKVQQGYKMLQEGADPNAVSPVAQQLIDKMTESDWALVNLIHSQLDLLYPKTAELAERITGVKPPKVEALGIETPFGTMPGGYVPLRKRRTLAEQANDADSDINDLFNERDFFNNVGVDTSSRYDRTEAVYEVELGLGGLSDHIREATHFVTHYDAVKSINRLIRDPRVERMIREHLSDSDFEQLLPWLVSVARDGRDSSPKSALEKAVDHLRLGTTMVAMGFKASTSIMQTLGLFNSAKEVGAGNLAKGLTYFVRSPDEALTAVQFAMTHSKIMSTRMQTMDREMANALDRVGRTRAGRIVDRYKDAAFAPIAYVQMYAVDLPTWHGAFAKEMKASGVLTKAAQYADWVVENVQGSGRNQTASGIMRSKNSWVQAATMFMTFFSSLFNQSRDLSQKFHNKDLGVIEATSAMLYMFTLPVIAEMLLRGDWPDENEDDVALQLFANLVSYPMATMPILRDAFSSMRMEKYFAGETSNMPFYASPVLSTGADTLIAAATIPKLFDENKELSRREKEAIVRSVGAWLHIPGTGQGIATSRHLTAWLEEGEDFSPRQLLMGQDRQK